MTNIIYRQGFNLLKSLAIVLCLYNVPQETFGQADGAEEAPRDSVQALPTRTKSIVFSMPRTSGRIVKIERAPRNDSSQTRPAPRSIMCRNSLRLNPDYPLYVIDGVMIVHDDMRPAGNDSLADFIDNPLAHMDPNTIDSIEILKDDDATAIYGSRRECGVI